MAQPMATQEQVVLSFLVSRATYGAAYGPPRAGRFKFLVGGATYGATYGPQEQAVLSFW